MEFEFDLGRPRPDARRLDGQTTRILILADFMGASAAAAPPLDRRPIAGIDVDNFDDVFRRFEPSVALPALGLQAPLVFRELDDFHPDRVFETVQIFDGLRTLRQRLQDPSTFTAAADELRSSAPVPAATPPALDASAAAEEAGAAEGSLLERLLGTKPPPPASAARPTPQTALATGVDAYIRSLVAPHIVAASDPRLPQFLSAVDAAIGDAMRALLHDAAFQRLEAAWRGVRWLLAEIGDVGEDAVEIALLQLTRGELMAQAEPASDLHRRLVPRGADATSWSLVVADVAFGASEPDMVAVNGLAGIAGSLGVPFVAAAGGALVGCEDVRTQADPRAWASLPEPIARLWTEARALPGGRQVGLTWPRFILRLPYGRKSDPIARFAFEELATGHAHEDYLWGNGGFAAALVQARILSGGSDGLEGDIGNLPAYTYVEDGQTVLKPCAEFCMTERGIDEALARGVIPLVSYQNRNAIRLVRLQSIAQTALGTVPVTGDGGQSL
jgi:type VI secretion system protein ImpC